MRYFEDLEIGDERTSNSVLVTANEIIEFATRFDPQPFHIDVEAAKASHFGGLVASGTHTLAYWRLMDHQINHDIQYICGLEYEHVKLITPLRAGDEMYLRSKIVELIPSRSKKDRGIVKIEYWVYNQNDEILARLLCTSLVKTRPA